MKYIRNFSIIAHIDHGKSTLADRFLETTGALSQREMSSQYLDRMDLERERGITIKAQTVRLFHEYQGETYQFNLIDTPGHVDFSYEVSRSLAACEGALLLVDASQGVQAQTLAHTYEAIEQDLELMLLWNKIDLPNADIPTFAEEVQEMIGISVEDSLSISAKSGQGVKEVLDAIVEKIPPPKGEPDGPLKALLFDSWYDPYLGVVGLVRILDGQVKKGDPIIFMQSGKEFIVERVGVLAPNPVHVDALKAGEVGFFAAAIKNISDAKVGDTITHVAKPTSEAMPGFREVKPTVFCGMFPTGDQDVNDLRDALEKLQLNDTAIRFEPESSVALGFGFRCGFLGLLHMEIVQERLEREFDVELITTAPTVEYKVVLTDGSIQMVDNPSKLPDPVEIDRVEEPIIQASIHVPTEYLGGIMALCQEKRGVQTNLEYPTPNRVVVSYDLPLSEVVFDFYDKLKSASRGYASLDYHFDRFEPAKMVKLDMMVNGDRVDALSVIVHRDHAYYRGRELAKKLKEVVPKQMFEIAIQAALGNKIIARESISAMRKNVTAKCYGGDISRKKKLLERQKEGKKRMKRLGNIDLPQEAFLAILKT